MPNGRVMMIGLDGFELSIADRLLAEGRLPALRRLRERGANMLLDHGAAKRTGLAWEHVSTGLSPDDARRWSAIDFDPATYRVSQRPTSTAPFAASLDASTLVFDAPYFDLKRAPSARGFVNWGAHDPGVVRNGRPDGLAEEIEARFGPYPAKDWIYGFVWPSADRTREMAEALVRAVEVRADIAEWMFAERLPDWDLGLIVIAEYHSAAEAFWHGIDPSHPLHALPSAEPARRGLEGVYESADRLLGRLMDRFPDARFAVFNLHGMGLNSADVAAMALLPELLYRHSFGRPCLGEGDWEMNPAGVPLIESDLVWESEIERALPRSMRTPGKVWRGFSRLAGRLLPSADPDAIALEWMPTARYRKFWPRMTAFALPSFYDGQIRINLRGREARGLVDPADHGVVCDGIEALLRECREPLTGEPVVASVERADRPGHRLDASEADLTILWHGTPLGLEHPELGRIGPLPWRRVGGHTGALGIAHFAGPGIPPGDHGTRSAFDIVPTVVDMLGGDFAGRLSGTSLQQEIEARPPVRAPAGA
jgi:predicted AlkP superfamily phosphohydrolase/phosphomutase